MNSLGSLYYFIKITLRRRRLNSTYHYDLCASLEKDHLKDVHEEPRDHFKSTCATEGLSMWRVLPFSSKDEAIFRALGYSEEFVNWMKRMHRPDARNLLVSENITNAAKLGQRLRWHYESNQTYRSVFPETLPDKSCKWCDTSLQLRLPPGSATGGHGEGTFDFLGVGGALQSRHYNGLLIQDDLVGRKAIESPTVMDKTIDYHKLVAGAFEGGDANHENDELLIGNRWAFTDLNSYVHEHEPWFHFERHSALGGCCDKHPADTPIFPEEFSFEKLMRIQKRFGTYFFSCQYLNNPAAPENADFKPEWLGYFSLHEKAANEGGFVTDPIWVNMLSRVKPDLSVTHEVKDGIVRKDFKVGHLAKVIITDPNHSGNAGRCRHAILVVGLSSEGDFYLLDCWAKACGYEEYYNEIYKMVDRWQMRRIGVETVAAQKYVAFHIQYRNKLEGRTLKIDELKGEVEGPDGELTRKKEFRIRNVILPIAEFGHLFIQRRHVDFFGEFTTFPKGRYWDMLDCLAYAPQLLRIPTSTLETMSLLAQNQRRAQQVHTPYGTRVN